MRIDWSKIRRGALTVLGGLGSAAAIVAMFASPTDVQGFVGRLLHFVGSVPLLLVSVSLVYVSIALARRTAEVRARDEKIAAADANNKSLSAKLDAANRQYDDLVAKLEELAKAGDPAKGELSTLRADATASSRARAMIDVRASASLD